MASLTPLLSSSALLLHITWLFRSQSWMSKTCCLGFRMNILSSCATTTHIGETSPCGNTVLCCPLQQSWWRDNKLLQEEQVSFWPLSSEPAPLLEKPEHTHCSSGELGWTKIPFRAQTWLWPNPMRSTVPLTSLWIRGWAQPSEMRTRLRCSMLDTEYSKIPLSKGIRCKTLNEWNLEQY